MEKKKVNMRRIIIYAMTNKLDYYHGRNSNSEDGHP